MDRVVQYTKGSAAHLTKLRKLLTHDLQRNLEWYGFWERFFARKGNSMHLGVFIEPYLSNIIDGKKTIESRFSINQCAPFHKVRQGDVLLLKKSGGPIVGVCKITSVWYYRLDVESWKEIKENYASSLCIIDPSFWKAKETAEYATLMCLSNVCEINPIQFNKKDRRGWVVLHNSMQESLWLK